MDSAQQVWLDQVGSVLETLNQGVIINNDRKQIVFVNSKFLEVIKMSADDLLGQSIVNLYPPEDVPPLLDFIARRETQGRALYEFISHKRMEGGASVCRYESRKRTQLPFLVICPQSARYAVVSVNA